MRPFQEQTYYELLGIPLGASREEIQSAHGRLSALSDGALAAQRELTEPSQLPALRARLLEAFEILSDLDLRAEYDRSLGRAPTDPSQAEPEPVQLAFSALLGRELVSGPVVPRPVALSYLPRTPRGSWGEQSASDTTSESPGRPEPRPAPAPPPLSAPSAEAPRPWLTPPDVPPRLEGDETDAAPTAPGVPPPAPTPGQAKENRSVAPELASESALGIAESALTRLSAKVREVKAVERVKPLELPADAVFRGELLRQIRQRKGLSLDELADRTRIGQRHLANIEADRYDSLPATVYLRGILMSMARELGLDPLRVSKSYLAVVAEQREK